MSSLPVSTGAGHSELARILRQDLADAAKESGPALLEGESHVGQEQAAHELHLRSGRKGKFVRVNPAGLAPAIGHYADGRVDPGPLVHVVVGLDRAVEAFDGRLDPSPGTKIHIDPRA